MIVGAATDVDGDEGEQRSLVDVAGYQPGADHEVSGHRTEGAVLVHRRDPEVHEAAETAERHHDAATAAGRADVGSDGRHGAGEDGVGRSVEAEGDGDRRAGTGAGVVAKGQGRGVDRYVEVTLDHDPKRCARRRVHRRLQRADGQGHRRSQHGSPLIAPTARSRAAAPPSAGSDIGP